MFNCISFPRFSVLYFIESIHCIFDILRSARFHPQIPSPNSLSNSSYTGYLSINGASPGKSLTHKFHGNVQCKLYDVRKLSFVFSERRLIITYAVDTLSFLTVFFYL